MKILMAFAAAAAAWIGLAAGAAAQAQAGEAAQEQGLTLKVVSYNIRYGAAPDGPDHWENRKGEVARLLREHEADVVGLQEALRGQLDDLASMVQGYGEIGVGRNDGKTKGEYAAILYRKDRFSVVESGTFWLSDTPETPGSRSWGNRITRICTWARLRDEPTGRTFYVFNTHLDHESQPSRERSVDLIARRIAERPHAADPVVVTGDFNAGESNPAIRRLTLAEPSHDAAGRGQAPFLLDTFRVVHPDEPDASTFNNFGKPGATRDKIDYIFVQPGTRVISAGIDRRSTDGRFPSDHYAVWAKIEFPAQ